MNSPPSSDQEIIRMLEEIDCKLTRIAQIQEQQGRILGEYGRSITEVQKKICKPPKKQAEWRNYIEQLGAKVIEQQFMLPRSFIEISGCSYGDWSRYRSYAIKNNPDLTESPMRGSNQIILHYRTFDTSSIQSTITDLSKEPASSPILMERLLDCIKKSDPAEYVKEYGFHVQRYLSDNIFTRAESQGTRERALDELELYCRKNAPTIRRNVKYRDFWY